MAEEIELDALRPSVRAKAPSVTSIACFRFMCLLRVLLPQSGGCRSSGDRLSRSSRPLGSESVDFEQQAEPEQILPASPRVALALSSPSSSDCVSARPPAELRLRRLQPSLSADWRTTADTSANFFIRFSVKKRKRRAEKPLKRPLVQVLLERAEKWQQQLDSGEVKTRAEIARRVGCAAARVSNIMNLLRLAPKIQQRIRELPLGTSRSVISERRLREMARLPWTEQLGIWAGRGNERQESRKSNRDQLGPKSSEKVFCAKVR